MEREKEAILVFRSGKRIYSVDEWLRNSNPFKDLRPSFEYINVLDEGIILTMPYTYAFV